MCHTWGQGPLSFPPLAYTPSLAHTHAHMHTHTHSLARSHTHTHALMHTHTHAHAHTFSRMHAHTNTHTHMHVHPSARTHTHACIHAHAHAHAHTHARAPHSKFNQSHASAEECLARISEVTDWDAGGRTEPHHLQRVFAKEKEEGERRVLSVIRRAREVSAPAGWGLARARWGCSQQAW